MLTHCLLDMFRALRKTRLPENHVWSVTVGASSKQTLASWHLLEPSDVIATIALLNSREAEDTGLEMELGLGLVGEGRFPDTRL
jgi:trehalose 6-phosphate synthase/phosphatase